VKCNGVQGKVIFHKQSRWKKCEASEQQRETEKGFVALCNAVVLKLRRAPLVGRSGTAGGAQEEMQKYRYSTYYTRLKYTDIEVIHK